MPSKRQSFFDKVTNVVNAPQRTDVSDTTLRGGNETPNRHMRVEVPVKPERIPVSPHQNEEEIGQLLVDVYESDGNIVVQAMIAGVTPENLQIAITRERLTIRGRREMPNDNTEAYHMNELYWGAFERVIDLPYEVDPDGAEAVEKYGLLIVRLPRLDTDKIQELRVKSV